MANLILGLPSGLVDGVKVTDECLDYSTASIRTSSAGSTSSINSTTQTVSGGATFTGEWEQNTQSHVMVSCKTDADCTLYFDFSNDGVNIDTFPVAGFFVLSGIHEFHKALKGPRYFRVRLVCHSGETPTYTRLYTYYGLFPDANTPLNQSISLDADAIATRPTNYYVEAALGLRSGHALWNKFGYNSDVDVGTEVIASWGGTFTPLTTATTLIISSSSINDTSGGTGCNSVYISGIDANREPQVELVTLTGTTAVVTTSTWLGINRVSMYLCGTSQVNEGLIGVIASTGGSTMAVMPTGEGTTQQCIFHVPTGYKFVAEWVRCNVLNRGKNAELTIKMWVYSAVSNGKQNVYTVSIDTSTTNNVDESPNIPFPITESTVIWLECTTDTNDIEVNARFSGILVKDV